ncbi:hypothetical protein AMD27_11380 [Acinetobacter sp. TGL-Y2]|uniref:hypothetical protein n=1 Tax=Acinetobacter sp. TGL-Y2 TaxID=1407071 RepID=UPI0007A66921|nr:hypothetical protein [Acinetobacter sp. TGL-Y2]AMW79431.1 hypothetical protein AMD27_11380 [Acinetobacter sp. TGL-Y2]
MKNQKIKISISLLLLLVGGCMGEKKQDIYKIGETVTWKFNDGLIIKAQVGSRRIHIPYTQCEKCEGEFYRPELQHYLGQFPINYKSTKYPELNKIEAKKMPQALTDGRGFEFNLMLDGSTVQATDKGVDGDYTLDHSDQIKVVIKSLGASTKKNTKEFFDSELIEKINLHSKQTLQSGLDCYELKDTSAGKICFGYSKNNSISGFYFYVSPDQKLQIKVHSEELVFGGVIIDWIIDQKHIDKVQLVDENIWRLIKNWNISPIN